MAHVKITNGSDSLSLRIIVDGVDVSNCTYRDGFGLVRVGDEWGVQMIVAADALDVDLPDAIVKAMRAEEVEQ